MLDQCIELLCPTEKLKKLKDVCRTRWIQRIDSYAVFLDLLSVLVTALKAMVCPGQHENLRCNWDWDGESVTKASGFIHHLESTSFLVAFKVLLEVLTNLRGLTTKLQMQAADVFYAYKKVAKVVDGLKTMRSSSESEFSPLFQEASKLGKALHGEEFELSLPRINSRRQVHRRNIPVQNAEDYYRITVYNEFLSHVISELESRFAGLLHLLPSECHTSTSILVMLSDAVDFYSDDLPMHSFFQLSIDRGFVNGVARAVLQHPRHWRGHWLLVMVFSKHSCFAANCTYTAHHFL